jgi:hypothetical protein
LQPQIFVDFPEREEELAILRENVPFSDDSLLDYVTEFLQQAHAADERYTVRDGINIARFVAKLERVDELPVERSATFRLALTQILGEEALRYAP